MIITHNKYYPHAPKYAAATNFPLLEKKNPKLQIHDISFPNSAFQNLLEQDTSHHNRQNSETKNVHNLSNKTNESFLKNFLKQQTLKPLEQSINLSDQKKINNSFQIVSREMKKNDIRTKVIRTHTRDLSANSNINANNTTTRRINYQNNEKKETTIDKTNKLMKIYNPIPPQQIPKKKMSSYHINSKKEKRKNHLDDFSSNYNNKKNNDFDNNNNVINSPLENHSSSTLSMSFGNSDFQKALGIDIKHLIDKGFNNNGNNHDDSSGKNINIIGKVNYENINFNFTFSKTDLPEVKNEEKIPDVGKKTNIFKRKASKSKEKSQKAVLFQRNKNDETEHIFKELHPYHSKPNSGTYTMNLRETPTFNLPMHYYKECNEKRENEIPLKKEIDQSQTQKVKPPNIYSTDLLLDDLMKDLKKNGLFKFDNESIQINTSLSESPVQIKEKIPKKVKSSNMKFNLKDCENPNMKCLLIDFDQSSSEDGSEEILARNDTQNESDGNNFKIIKTKNLEVLDLDDF